MHWPQVLYVCFVCVSVCAHVCVRMYVCMYLCVLVGMKRYIGSEILIYYNQQCLTVLIKANVGNNR